MKRFIRNGVIDVEKLTELWKSNVPEKFVNTFAPLRNRYYSLLKTLDIEFYVKDDILHVGLIVDYDLQKKSLEKDLHKLQYLFREITGIGDLILYVVYREKYQTGSSSCFGEEYANLEEMPLEFKKDFLKRITCMKKYETTVKIHIGGFLIEHERFWQVVGLGIIHCPVLFSKHRCNVCHTELVYISYRHSVRMEDEWYVDMFGTLEMCPNCLKRNKFYLENEILGSAPFIRGNEYVEHLGLDL